jgi:hypothetical protein
MPYERKYPAGARNGNVKSIAINFSVNEFRQCCILKRSLSATTCILYLLRLYWILGGIVLVIIGIVIFFWSWSSLPDDQLFQSHPTGEPLSREQQIAYQHYQTIWAIASLTGSGGVAAIIYGVRKDGAFV